MKKNLENQIRNAAQNKINPKYNLAQYKEGGSKHNEKLNALKHKEICEQIIQFAENHKDIPLYAIITIGVGKNACKLSILNKGYKKFDQQKVEMVYKMGRAYNDYNGQNKRKLSDVTIRLITKYYEQKSNDYKQFIIDLNNSKHLGKLCGSRDIDYKQLCDNLSINEKKTINNDAA